MNVIIWVIVGIIVVIAIVGIVVFMSRQRRVAKVEADRGRAEQLRSEAQEGDLAAREREIEAKRAQADAQQAQVESERLQREAAQRQADADGIRARSEEQFHQADDVDPDVGTGGDPIPEARHAQKPDDAGSPIT